MRQIDVGGEWPITLDEVDGIQVVRDDLVPGGTKARVLSVLFDDEHDEYVYASPVQGYAQVALAYTAEKHNKLATVFCAERREKHRLTLECINAGAQVIEVGPPAFLTVVQKRAADYAKARFAKLLPFGLKTKEIMDALTAVAKCIDEPDEVWSVASSGTLTLSLQAAWPNASFHAVRIGAVRDVGRARVWESPERFERDAKHPPPFPSCLNYDAKSWQFIVEHATPGALLWNVAG